MTVIMEPGTMPGTFLPENDSSFRRPRFKASPFLPPDSDSPNPSSSWSQKPQLGCPLNSTAAHVSEDQQYSRKRPRLNTKAVHDDLHTNLRSAHHVPPSPSPFVNTNYRIAGGLDAPAGLTIQQEEDAHEFDYEIDCRPSRYNNHNSRRMSDSYFPQTPAPDEDARNKRISSPPSPPMKGWGNTVWAVTGGFAGKVMNFCLNTTFAGFHSGGGAGYRFDVGNLDIPLRDDVFHNDYNGLSRRGDRAVTPVPGGFPEDGPEFIEDYMSKLTVNQEQKTALTPTKNSRGECPAMSRYNSWVVVDAMDGNPRSRESSPARKKSKASTANLYAAQPSPALRQLSHTLSRPRLTPRSSTGRSSASYASPRLSVGGNFTPQHQPRRSTSSVPIVESHQPEVNNTNGASNRPSSAHANRASLNSPRRPSSTPQTGSTPKPSPEVRKFEQKMRKKEAKQNANMAHFNDRLQSMIREGQAALGSRVEVETEDSDEDLDEGFYEGGEGKRGAGPWQRQDNRHWSRS